MRSALCLRGRLQSSLFPSRCRTQLICAQLHPTKNSASLPHSTTMVSASDMLCVVNPLLADWAAAEPFGLPPFAAIRPEHFRPAFDTALAAHLEEIRAIAEDAEPPSFTNTALALDRVGELSTRIGNLFGNLCSSDTR